MTTVEEAVVHACMLDGSEQHRSLFTGIATTVVPAAWWETTKTSVMGEWIFQRARRMRALA